MPDFRDQNSKYHKFLTSEADIPEPPAGLQHKVMRRIEAAKRRALIIKTTGFGLLFAGSIAILVAAYLNLTAALVQSGFLNFASLFFSDFGVAMANFQDFAFSIVESFPVFSAAFLIAGVIAVIWSAAHFIEDISQMRAHGNWAIGV
jgi:hypothetical protein